MLKGYLTISRRLLMRKMCQRLGLGYCMGWLVWGIHCWVCSIAGDDGEHGVRHHVGMQHEETPVGI